MKLTGRAGGPPPGTPGEATAGTTTPAGATPYGATTQAAPPARELANSGPVTRASDARAALALAPFATRWVLGVGAVFVALELAMSARYGIHRDELYFLACARHLAWGYVDQPPLVPAVAWLVNAIAGPSAVGLRILPAFAGGGAVVVSALMARELGGRRAAQVVAALAAASSLQLLDMFHLLSTSAFDSCFWSVLTWLTLRLCRTGNRRLLYAIGAVSGVALMNKLNVAILLAALVLSVAAGPYRRLLMCREALAAGAIALVLFSPDLAWNATHDWAQLAMLRALHGENSTLGASLEFIPAQLVVVGPFVVPLVIAGLIKLLRHPIGRPLAVSYLTLMAFYTLTGAKPYYLAGIYYVLFAGGGVALEERLANTATAGRPRRWAVRTILGTVVCLPLVLPVLPASTLPRSPWEGQINKDLSATLGWPSFVHQVAGIADRLPSSERARLVVYTGDYGAAGAVDLYGGALGLPHAISGHNNYWWWGYGRSPNDSTTIAVNLPSSYLQTIFLHVVQVGSVQSPGDSWTEERGDPIFVCTGQKQTWAAAWPAARHYG